MNQFDPSRAIEAAAAQAAEGNGHPPAAPPLILQMQNCSINVVDAKDAAGARLKLIRIAHTSGGLIVDVPMPPANARIIGNALCDRPNITLPGA